MRKNKNKVQGWTVFLTSYLAICKECLVIKDTSNCSIVMTTTLPNSVQIA